MTLQEIEAALKAGEITWCSAGNPWMVRRNGVTKTWKTRPDEYKIPVKVGFRNYAYITPETEFVGKMVIRF